MNYKQYLKSKGLFGIYNSWIGMRQRCRNPRNPKWYRYGGRGITVCKEWESVYNFVEWSLEHGWKKGYQIDRIDNDGNYCKENCRWVSVSENARKKGTTKIDMITAQEIRSRINENWYDLAKEYGCSHGNIWFIMKNFTHVPIENACINKIRERSEKKRKF